MKSYSVKSNAKRFARGVAAKYPGDVEVAEPLETAPGSRLWYATVSVISGLEEHCSRIVSDFGPDAVYVYGYTDDPEPDDAPLVPVTGLEQWDLGANLDAVPPAKEGEPLRINADPSVLTEGFEQPTQTLFVTGRGDATGVRTADEMAALAATLPPPVKSSREEIDARRAERRQRIDAEKAAGTRTASGDKVKINKTNVILDLVKRPNGATQVELESATGWQRHTLRGYIAGTLRKRLAPVGKDIECRRAKGEETRYVLVAAKGGEA